MASSALAETTITTAVTTPVTTATATSAGPDDLRVTADGSVKPTVAGAIVTVNSNNSFTNAGTLSTVNIDNSAGILMLGGYTGKVVNNLSISIGDDYDPTDTDSDGDLDGVFANGANRYGIRLIGPGAFTGDISNNAGATISAQSNNANGVSVETTLLGSVFNAGTIIATGSNSYGVHTTGLVSGNITSLGSISAVGQGSVGMALDGDVSGQVRIQGQVLAFGYRYTERPVYQEIIDKLDSDDLLQGGSALRISGNVGGGLYLDGPPADLIADDSNATTTTDSDEDGDGIADAAEGIGSIVTYGRAPAAAIGSDTHSVTLGAVGTGDLAYGIVNKGTISGSGVYDGIDATAMLIGGSTGQSTVITNGIRNAGSAARSDIHDR